MRGNDTAADNDIGNELLFELENYIKSIWSFVPLPLAYINPAGFIVEANNTLVELFNLKKDLIIGKLVSFLSSDFDAVHKETIKKESIYNREIELILNKEKKSFLLSTQLNKDEEGNKLGYFLSLIDITDRKKFEDELKKNEDKLKVIIENTGTAILIANPDRRIALTNKGFEDLTGYKREELVNKAYWTDIVSKKYVKSMIRYNKQRMLNKEAPKSYEFDLVTKTGDIKRALLFVELLPRTKQTLASLIDITARKKLEDQSRRENERIKSLLKIRELTTKITEKELADYAINECVRLTDSKVGYLHFYDENTKQISLHTWSRNVIKNCYSEKTTHYPLAKAGIWADSVRLRKPVVHNDYPNVPNKKGYPRGHFPLLRHLGIPVIDDNKIVLIIGVGNKDAPYDSFDAEQLQLFTNSIWQIIKQKRIETALKESEERHRLLFEGSSDMILSFDKNGQLTEANKSFLTTMGYDTTSIKDLNINKLVQKELSKHYIALFNQVKRGNKIDFFESIFLNKNNEPVFVEGSLVPIIKNNQLTNIWSIIRDVTIRKKEESLRLEREKEKEIRDLKDQFMMRVSHELRQPLVPIIGYSRVMLEENPSEIQRKYLEKIIENSTYLKNLINKVIEINSLQTGIIKLELTEVKTDYLINQVVSDYQTKATIKGLKLITDYKANPALKVDALKLKDAISNLVDNAIKFTEHGSVRIIVTKENNKTRITIKDTGRGLTKEELIKIRQNVTQVKSEVAELYTGLKLGLLLVNLIIKAHNGELLIESKKGVGTTVSILI